MRIAVGDGETRGQMDRNQSALLSALPTPAVFWRCCFCGDQLVGLDSLCSDFKRVNLTVGVPFRVVCVLARGCWRLGGLRPEPGLPRSLIITVIGRRRRLLRGPT